MAWLAQRWANIVHPTDNHTPTMRFNTKVGPTLSCYLGCCVLCCVLEQRHINSAKSTGNSQEAVSPPDMTEKLLTGTLSINTIHPSIFPCYAQNNCIFFTLGYPNLFIRSFIHSFIHSSCLTILLSLYKNYGRNDPRAKRPTGETTHLIRANRPTPKTRAKRRRAERPRAKRPGETTHGRNNPRAKRPGFLNND